MKLFGNKTIEKMVMESIKNRIDIAQTKFDEGCKALDEQHSRDIEILKEKLEGDKTITAENLVNSILGKVL